MIRIVLMEPNHITRAAVERRTPPPRTCFVRSPIPLTHLNAMNGLSAALRPRSALVNEAVQDRILAGSKAAGASASRGMLLVTATVRYRGSGPSIPLADVDAPFTPDVTYHR